MPDGHVCWFVVGLLGVWRVTHLVTAEDGPWGVIATVRRWAGHGIVGQLLDCFNCTSLWVAALGVLMLPASWATRLMVGLALSGGAILLERVTAPKATAPVASYLEGAPGDVEDDDGLLRR